MSNLAQRILFGALGAVLLLGCVWYSAWTFAAFFALVQAIMLWEFYRMMEAGGYKPATWIGVAFSLYLFGLAVFLNFVWWVSFDDIGIINNEPTTEGKKPALFEGLLLAPAFLLTVVLLLREMIRWPRYHKPFESVAVTLLALVYVSLPMSFLCVLAFDKGYDYRRVIVVLFLLWTADIGAYAAGKTFGKHKLAPTISPGKTWEGFVGGFLLTLLMGWTLGYLLPELPLTHRLVAAAVVSVFGMLGDLAESMLKRSVGVKDSGRILPGHGGLLDRFDALLFVVPVLVVLQWLFGA